jgi:hypothetical protein
MKAVSNLVIALGFIAASGAAVAADRYEPTVNVGTNLSRAEVRAEAIAARSQAVVTESGFSIQSAPVASSTVTRTEVRMAALSSRDDVITDNAN